MKKLFTLVVAAFAALVVNAEVKDLVTDPITIAASLGDDNEAHWFESQPIILSATDVAVNDFLMFTITDAEAGEGEQNVLQVKKADGKALYYGSDGLNPTSNSVITIPVNQAILDEITSTGFKLGGAVQQKSGSWPAVVGKKIVVSKISVQPASDYMTLDLSSKNAPTTKSWAGGVSMPSANFKLAKAGDLIVLSITASDEIRPSANYQFIMGNAKLDFWNLPPFYVMKVTADDVANINSSSYLQCYYQGEKFPASFTAMLYRQKANLPTVETTVNLDATKLGEWENSVILDKEYFANAQAGDEIHLSLTDFQEYKKDGESWTRKGQLQMKSCEEGWPAISDLVDVFDVANTVFVLTDKQAAAAKEFGVVISGQCMTISGASVFTKTTSSNIANTIVTPATKDAKIYNLAGQQVNASYKGVVIKNGKKYVQ